MRIVVALMALLLAVIPARAEMLTLTGTISWSGSYKLPEGASLRLQVFDNEAANAPPQIDVAGDVAPSVSPLGFTLSLPADALKPELTYGLIAAISVNGRLVLRNFAPVPVSSEALTTPIEVKAEAVGTGAVTDMSSSAPAADGSALRDVTWRVTMIDEISVTGRRAPTLLIDSASRAGGTTGCNSWFAEARLADSELRFGAITATQKGCPGAVGEQEEAFRTALGKVVSWKLDSTRLRLFAADGKVLLELSP